MQTIMAICKSGRLHAIARALRQSKHKVRLIAFSEVESPGVRAIVDDFEKGSSVDVDHVVRVAREKKVDLVVIGPEEPLEVGLADALEKAGIGCVGPKRSVAKIEWSKTYGRELLSKYLPAMNPSYQVFTSLDGLEKYLKELGRFVVKPDGLTGGKGVQVWGDHFHTVDEGLAYCKAVLSKPGSSVVIEELLDGEEFTLQSFCDGIHVAHTFPVQDHKRLGNGDTGPNTGGMGSYSCADHKLPFLADDDIRQAQYVNEVICDALLKENGVPYKGILYGGFIATKDGIKVIEFNSRFGDPEVMNVLSLLESDFVELCNAIVDGTLDRSHVKFAMKASVCKYLVPDGYPAQGNKGVIKVSGSDVDTDNLVTYEASLNPGPVPGTLQLTGSRALAFVGIADTIEGAAAIAEAAASKVEGPVVHRTDIGTAPLIQRRVDHMERLRSDRKKNSRAA